MMESPPGSFFRKSGYDLRTSSCSLAIFAAIRRTLLQYLAPDPHEQISFTHHLTDAVPILRTRAPVSIPPLSPGKSRNVGAFYLRNSPPYCQLPLSGRK